MILSTFSLQFWSQNNDLEDTTRTLRIQFMGWGCDCPNWCEEANYTKFFDDRDTAISTQALIDQYCFNIEAATEENEIDWSSFWDNYPLHKVEVEGSFYLELQNWPGDDRIIQSKVFRYTNYRLIE